MVNSTNGSSKFSGFTAQQFEALGGIFEPCHYDPGVAIVRQNDPATYIYYIVEGAVEIRHLPFDGPTMQVDRLGEGDVFGWSALLGRTHYTATVTTIESSVIYRSTPAALQTLCSSNHDAGVVLLEQMVRSVTQSPNQTREAIKTVLARMMNCGQPQ